MRSASREVGIGGENSEKQHNLFPLRSFRIVERHSGAAIATLSCDGFRRGTENLNTSPNATPKRLSMLV
jgi:hypothetical protein